LEEPKLIWQVLLAEVKVLLMSVMSRRHDNVDKSGDTTRGFVDRWHQELRNAAEEMNLNPHDVAIFAGRAFVEMPKAARPLRAIDIYKREIYATYKRTGKDACDKSIMLKCPAVGTLLRMIRSTWRSIRRVLVLLCAMSSE